MKTNKQKLVLMEGREVLRTDRSAECEELLLMKEESDKRTRFLQYINTGLLTLILAVASMTATTLINVKEKQSIFQTELIRLKTVQDINVLNVASLSNRVNILEVKYVDDIKGWVEANYIRKAQK